MSESTTKRPFWEAKNLGFSEATPACDLLHPVASLPSRASR